MQTLINLQPASRSIGLSSTLEMATPEIHLTIATTTLHFTGTRVMILPRGFYGAENVTFFKDSPSTFNSANEGQTLKDQKRQEDENAGKISDRLSNDLVKSFFTDHSASYLCEAPGSAGPIFVSYPERHFCFMPTKTVYPFCDDVPLGLCWNDDLGLVIPKLVDIFVPVMNFTRVTVWGDV